jgi:hypothetical protein
MDTWRADAKDPDASPGHVVHYYLDTSDTLGSAWAWEQITRRLGYSYVFDWGDVGRDFVTVGLPLRPWDRVERVPGHEIFNYFDVKTFAPDGWKNEYANPAFDRMTERDAAWMARILARFTPEAVRALAAMAKFTDPSNTEYLASVLEGRLKKILDRYLTRLSPLSDVHVEGGHTLCATDVAARRRFERRVPSGSPRWTRRGTHCRSSCVTTRRPVCCFPASPPMAGLQTKTRPVTCGSRCRMASRAGRSSYTSTTSALGAAFASSDSSGPIVDERSPPRSTRRQTILRRRGGGRSFSVASETRPSPLRGPKRRDE